MHYIWQSVMWPCSCSWCAQPSMRCVYMYVPLSGFNKWNRLVWRVFKPPWLDHGAILLVKRQKYERMTPAFKALYWLFVQHRLGFRLWLIVYKYLTTGQPTYQEVVLISRSRQCSARSFDCVCFVIHYARTTHWCTSFSIAESSFGTPSLSVRSAQ